MVTRYSGCVADGIRNKITELTRPFLKPSNATHRKYEALRSFFVDHWPAQESAKIRNESFSRHRKEARTAPPNATPSESASWLSENKTTPSMTFIRCWKSQDTNSVSPLFGRPFGRRDLPAYPDAPMRNARPPYAPPPPTSPISVSWI